MWLASTAQADILFSETFNGYDTLGDFSTFNPPGDPVDPGIPEISEGASEFWYGGRFEVPDNGSINSDLAVQQNGGSGNSTPVGRVADDAGMLFPIPVGYEDVVLSFDWRTFQAETTDRLVVGYYVGDLGFDTGANRFRDFINDDFGGNQTAAESWWANDWVQLMRVSASDSFHHQVYALPDDVPLWIVFWMDNGNGDFGKIDNIVVTGTPVENIPEPSSVVLMVIGVAALVCLRWRKVARQR